VLRVLSESLRLEYAQFLELEVFTRFGTMVDERTRKQIEHGRRIRAVLIQRQFAPLSLGEQVALLLAVATGVLDAVPLEQVDAFRAGLHACLAECCPEVLALDDQAEPLSEALHAQLKSCLDALAKSLPGAPP
jgi:F0F1-type ATP synthase alpha subunit